MRLSELAIARSGDKGSSANIGVIAKNKEAYKIIKEKLTAERVSEFFGGYPTIRYELDNLESLNFVIQDILKGGVSLSLSWDPQGKGLAQELLEMEL